MSLSLVDYASSSDDERAPPQPQQSHEPPPTPPPPPRPPSPPKAHLSADQNQDTSEKLPDASLLLNSPAMSLMSGKDHVSAVAAAMTESASRKRESNSKGMIGLGLSGGPRAKLPRATLTHSKSVPDTGGGVLVPPQLKGRSNVVTEDISKLFVNRHAAQPRGPEN